MKIDKTAIVSDKAKIEKNVAIGPYTVIEEDVTIGEGTAISAGAYIYSGTSIGAGCKIHMGVCLGDEPQDLAYTGEASYLKIGDNNTFREHVTVHKGTAKDTSTIIGDNNYFMCLSHVAHNCHIANNVIVCNNVLLGGYVEIEDKAFLAGGCLVHQFTRIGTLAMIGGGVRLNKDFPPFMSTGNDNIVTAYNVIGIRRANISAQARKEIKEAFRILYRSGLNQSNALNELQKVVTTSEAQHIIDFIRASKRGVCASHSNRNIE
jgi:UDP-N-acetylglucosamine acyltransferase